MAALASVIALVGAAALAVRLWPTGGTAEPGPSVAVRSTSTTTTTTTTHTTTTHPPPGPPFAVGIRTVRLIERSRSVDTNRGVISPRVLETEIRYPALGAPGTGEHEGAPAARRSGPFPLIVFGHGDELTPAYYARLLDFWTRQGYVVAAPIFPGENKDAPGGPDRSDLVNEPGDMKFLISWMIGQDEDPSSGFSGLIEPGEIAVSGHSDGGDTALQVAYSPQYRDPLVKAAAILAGAYGAPYFNSFSFPSGGPPLLAAQGTADEINHPSETDEYFSAAPSPKYLLELIGGGHLPPFTYQEPQLEVVEHVTLDFFNSYLKHQSGALNQMEEAGSMPGVANIQMDR